MTTTWQVAAGDGNRDYSEVFLNFGVILSGPGDRGRYDGTKEPYAAWPFIRAMAEEVADGDFVALKRPHGQRWEILAVGKVHGGYEWLENFEFVEGWDLQHARRVKWRVPQEPVFIEGLRRGTLARVNAPIVQERIGRLWDEGVERSAVACPPVPPPLNDEELISGLLDDGLQVGDAETVAATLRRVRRLAGWYLRCGRDNSEHETRTFLVVPLLLALGWSEQRIKVEWNSLDVALFKQPYEGSSQPSVIVETKRLGEGLGGAERQVLAYAKEHPSCEALVVTDGIGYKLLKKAGEVWKHAGTLNLCRPRRHHLYLDGVGGAEIVLRALLPEQREPSR